jgi:hypothetical protein
VGIGFRVTEMTRLLVLDVLETYAREREIDVYLVRRSDPPGWSCVLIEEAAAYRGSGTSARQAIEAALNEAGVEVGRGVV